MSIVGYGASGRANTLIQYCGIDESLLDYIIDDAPMKHGYFTPGSHLKIFSRDILKQKKPDYILIFAWSFFNEIIEKNIKYLHEGVKFIIPLPKVKIVSFNSGSMLKKFMKTPRSLNNYESDDVNGYKARNDKKWSVIKN